MKRRSLLVAALLAGALTIGSQAQAKPTTWNIDPAHSRVSFTVRHLFSKVPGNFNTFSGAVVFDPEKPGTGSVQVEIDANSINTNVEKRDNHLRSADFFDVAKYPKLTFVSTGVKDLGGGKLEIAGNLTMHGVTKPVTLAATVLGSGPGMSGKLTAGFEATTKLDRTEYGVVWNAPLDTGGTLLSNDVDITLNIEAVEHTEEAAPAPAKK